MQVMLINSSILSATMIIKLRFAETQSLRNSKVRRSLKSFVKLKGFFQNIKKNLTITGGLWEEVVLACKIIKYYYILILHNN
jgi:hypothetical protein